MSQITLRRAQQRDGTLLASHCAELLVDAGNDTTKVDLRAWAPYFAGMVVEGSYVAVIAEIGGISVGSAAYLIREMVSRPWLPQAREGRILDVYVLPSARRQGVARAMTEQLVAWAKDDHLRRLTLWPSDEGRAIYLAKGFTEAEELILRLEPQG